VPTIRRTTTFAATAGLKANPLVGSQYEYLPFDALVEIAILAVSAGAAAVEATMFSGTDVLLEDSPVPVVTAGGPKYPDDYDVRDVAAQGERLGLTLRNTTAVASDVTTVVKITPL
jgi:hypothetical protein